MGAKSAQNVKKNFCGSFQNFRKETRQITDIKGSPYLSGRYFSDSYRKIFVREMGQIFRISFQN